MVLTETINSIRFTMGVLISPYITASILLAPHYIFGTPNMFTGFAIVAIYFASYTLSIFIGLPIALHLLKKNKCTYTNLAITGFILGFFSFFIFNFSFIIQGDFSNLDNKIYGMIKDVLPSMWYGIAAAIGATLFGFISGISALHNK